MWIGLLNEALTSLPSRWSKTETWFLVKNKQSKAEVCDKDAFNRLKIDDLKDWTWVSSFSSIEVWYESVPN